MRVSHRNHTRTEFAPINVSTWEENGVWYVYSKLLGVLGYGNTKFDAKRSFRIQLTEIVNYQRDRKESENKDTVNEKTEQKSEI